MKTAIDTSALLAIFKAEATAEAWLNVLIDARRAGRLVICDVVYAELTPLFDSANALQATLNRLGIVYEPVTEAAAWRAGDTFRAYRKAGGPREHLIPDFLVGAHALVQADRLAAVDRGYLRKYFSKLKLLKPA